MEYLEISNRGEIEIDAFKKLGISVKETEDAIGEFGSGLNYAVAYFLRNEIPFKVFRGNEEVIFATKTSIFRNVMVEYITINGEETSFSINMGKGWKLWESIREIYTNSLDETSADICTTDNINPEFGKTKFYIGITPEVLDIINNWNNYFSDKRDDLLIEVEGVKIFRGGPKLIIYKKGFQVYTIDKPSTFHYQIDDVEINESRRIRDTYYVHRDIGRVLSNHLTQNEIDILLSSDKGNWEHKIDWDWYSVQFNKSWEEYLNDKKVVEDVMTDIYSETITKSKKTVITVNTSLMNKIRNKEYTHHIGGDLGNKVPGVIKPFNSIKGSYKIRQDLSLLKDKGYNIKCSIKGANGNFSITSNKRTIYITDKFAELSSIERKVKLIYENEKIKSGLQTGTKAFTEKIIENLIKLL